MTVRIDFYNAVGNSFKKGQCKTSSRVDDHASYRQLANFTVPGMTPLLLSGPIESN